MKYVKNSLIKKFTKRDKYSHKGENGKILLVAGSYEFPGAAALAAAAATASLRASIDLVVIAAPERVAYVVNFLLPDIITKKLKGKYFTKKHLKEILKLAKDFDAVVLGPGIGRRKETFSFVGELVKKVNVPIVVDADAIKALKGMKLKPNVLVTPHKKEFEILFGKKISKNTKLKNKIELVKSTAKKFNCTILLKNPVDIISDGKKVVLNKTGNAGMTVGGTGDVLAGLCGAFIALGASVFEAACCAAYVNGRAGDRLLKKKGYGFIASDLIEEIPKIIYR